MPGFITTLSLDGLLQGRRIDLVLLRVRRELESMRGQLGEQFVELAESLVRRFLRAGAGRVERFLRGEIADMRFNHLLDEGLTTRLHMRPANVKLHKKNRHVLVYLSGSTNKFVRF